MAWERGASPKQVLIWREETQVLASLVRRVRESCRLRRVDVPSGLYVDGEKSLFDRLIFTHAGLQSHSATMATSGLLAAPYHPSLSGNAHTWISTSGHMAALPCLSLGSRLDIC